MRALSVTILIAVTLLLPLPPARAACREPDYRVTVLLEEGDILPDGTELAEIEPYGVDMNDTGTAVFRGITGTGERAVFTQYGVVAKAGDTLPDTSVVEDIWYDNLNVTSRLSTPRINSNGVIAFLGETTGAVPSVFTQDGLVASEGDLLGDGHTFARQEASSPQPDEQDVVHFFDLGYWLDTAAGVVLGEGDVVGGATIGNFDDGDISTSGEIVVLDHESGFVHIQRIVSTTRGALVDEGDVLDDGSTVVDLPSQRLRINATGQTVFIAEVDTGNDALMNEHGVIVEEGDVLPDNSIIDDIDIKDLVDSVTAANGADINDAGTVVHVAVLDGAVSVYTQAGAIARVGDTTFDGAEITSLLNSVSGYYTLPTITNSDVIVFSAGIRRDVETKRAILVAQRPGAVATDWVTVGDPGNACEDWGYSCLGSVAEPYRIGKYEVTNAEYACFLNAVAVTDTHGLYNTNMAGGPGDHGGITRVGSSGSYHYSARAGREDRPVNWVTFWGALRFANWLHNGQPQGAQDATTTEDGAYTITPEGIASNDVPRNPGGQFFVASQDEWYKAAYYDTTPGQNIYFDYPTGTDTEIVCALPGPTPNTANCHSVVPGLTLVGSYTGSASPNGTFDQGGNVYEWTEGIRSGSYRVVHGGAFNYLPDGLQASAGGGQLPDFTSYATGFRLTSPVPAVVPSLSPAGIALLGGLVFAIAVAGLAVQRRLRTRGT